MLGASAQCDVQIDEPGVSARHAEICLIDGNTLLLKDLESATGTLLNGESVTEIQLGAGDEIRIGTCRWMLQAPGLRPERILTGDVVKKPVRRWSRVLGWGILLTATAMVLIKFKPEWLDLLRSFFN